MDRSRRCRRRLFTPTWSLSLFLLLDPSLIGSPITSSRFKRIGFDADIDVVIGVCFDQERRADQTKVDI